MSTPIRVSDLTHFEQNALDVLVAKWRAKRPRNNLRTAFYDMKNSERSLMDKGVPDVIRRRRFVLGWSALAVDKLNRRCNLDGFYEANGYDLSSLGIDELIRSNRLLGKYSQAGVSSLIHSVAFIITTQGDTQAGEPPVLQMVREAALGTGTWNVRRNAFDDFLSINDLDDNGEPVDMTLYLPNLNVLMSKVSGSWSVERREHVYGVPVDPLRYKPRTGREFGASRINRTVMSLHTQALAAMIRADVNGEAYSLPRYALLGATEEAFRNADGSQKPVWQAAWDAIWAIGDDLDQDDPRLARADVKQFHGQSPEPQKAHLRMIAEAFSGETSIPLGELGIIADSNPTSSEALQTSRDDLIAEAERTTDDWAPDVSAATTRALTMLNRGDVPPGLEVVPHYRSPIHVSRAQAADAGTKVLDKVPWLADTDVGLEILGLTPDQIRRAKVERSRANGNALLQRLIDRGASGGDVA